MKILHTESSCGWGGQELRILSESLGMMERGHEVSILCPPSARIYAEAQLRGIRAVAAPIERKSWRGFRALRQHLQHAYFDVVNTHSSTDTWLTALACATLAEAPPIVRTRHVSAPVPQNAMTRWLYKAASRHIVTTGESIRNALIEINGVPETQVSSIPTGIDERTFIPGDRLKAREALGLNGAEFFVGIVATLRSWKGHADLLQAFALLNPANAKLVVVGDGPQRENLEAQHRALNLTGRIVFAGNQTNVSDWLHAMDVFVLPSYANEGVPQALLQAMMCELACISTPVGGIPEIALDQRTALVVPSQDPQALAQAIALALKDPELRNRLGKAARIHCVERFSRDRMLDRMEAVFENVCTRPRSN